MARPSNFPDSRLAILRRYLGLQQQELANFLGISRSLLANLEANRRSLSQAVHERAAPLLALLPEGALPALLAALAPPAPDPAPPGHWLRDTYPHLLAEQCATAFTPDDAAQHHLLRLQAEAFETEAAALAALLAA